MSNIDNRIVSMQFDNESFERKLADTIASLDKLTASIEGLGAVNGLQDLSNEMDSFNIASMGDAIDAISGKLSAMGVVGFSVISNLTDQFISMAQNITGDVLGPVITGGKARANNIEQAKFQFRGLGLDVQAEMDSALAAVKGTAFGLDEAAKAAAQFGASGITAGDDLTASLRAIAGTAAMTNTSFSEIAQIFTSSAGTGKINTQDLLQFGYRGVNAAAAIAKQMGKTEQQVREMASQGKLDFLTFAKAMDGAFGEHATAANETYSGSLANMHAAMSRLGASFFGPKAEQMRDIFNSLTPVIDNVNAALQPLIQTAIQFGQIATFRIVTFLSNVNLEPLRIGVLYLTSAIENMQQVLQPILATLKWSFREVFPKGSESIIIKITRAINDFTAKIKIGDVFLNKIHIIFKSFFATLAIGKEIVKDAYGTFKALFGQLVNASGFNASPILDFFVRISDSINKVKGKLVEGGEINAFFMHLAYYIKQPFELIGQLRDKLVGMFKDVSTSATGPVAKGTEDSLGRIHDRLDQLRDIAGKVVDAWGRFMDFLGRIKPVLDDFWNAISTWLKEFGSKLADAFKPGDFNSVIDIINVGLLGGLLIMFKKFFDGDLLTKLGAKEFMDKLDTIFKGVTGTLHDMQTKLKTDALMNIAKAIFILSVGIVALSLIDSVNLTKALTAIAVGFGQLAVMMKLMDKLIGDKSAAAKIVALAAAMTTMAAAIDVMVPAIFALSRIKMGDLAKGLFGVAVGLSILVGATNGLTATSGAKMIAAGVGMTAMAGGLILMSIAVRSFGGIDWGVIGKGLLAITGLLFVITVGMSEMPINLPITAAGLVILGGALVALAEGLKVMGSIDWGTMGHGLAAIAGTLLLITVAMDSMPITLPITAAGLVILGGALEIMADVMKRFGNMDWGVIGKGLLGLAGMLLILDAAMQGLSGAASGALALIVVAGALEILTDVLARIGNLDTDVLIRGLSGIASALAILGLAGYLIAPVVPALIGLGVAIALIGAGMALFGAGALLFAKSMEIMSTAGIAGTKGIIEAIELMIKAIPKFLAAIILGITESLAELVAALPLVIRLIEAVLVQLLDTIIKLAPKIGQAFEIITLVALKVIQDLYPEFVKTGFGMLVALLHGISDNIGEITSMVADIIVHFINALSDKIPDIVDAVFNFWVTVLTTVVHKLGETIPTLMPELAIAFVTGLLDGFEKAFPMIHDFLVGLPRRMLDILKGALGITGADGFLSTGVDIITGIFNGMTEKFVEVLQWFGGLPDQIIGFVGDTTTWLKGAGLNAIGGFLIGIYEKAVELGGWLLDLPGKILGWLGDFTTTLKTKGLDLIQGLYNGIIIKAGDITAWFIELPDKIIGWAGNIASKLKDLGMDIIRGLMDGIWAMKDELLKKIEDLVSWIPGPIKSFLGIDSPSKVFRGFGVNIGQGLVLGLDDMSNSIKTASKQMGEHITANFNPDVSLDQISTGVGKMLDQIANMEDFNPVVTPVLDLTRIQAESGKLSDMLNRTSLSPDVTFANARLISSTATLEKPVTDAADQQPKGDVTFIQNNHSPEALSTHDIYRNTKSIMATAKEELGIA